MRKRFLAMGIAALMSMSLIACGGAKEEQKEEVKTEAQSDEKGDTGEVKEDSGEKTKLTLALRGGSYTEVIEKLIPEFEKENNVECEILDLSFDDLYQKIALDSKNKEGSYDIAMLDGSWLAEFKETGLMADLSALGYKLDPDFIKEAAEAGIDDGNVMCIPYVGNVNVFFYNKDLLKENGLEEAPKTWDEVLQVAKKIKESGKDGYLVRAQAGDNITTDFLPVLIAHGGSILADDNKTVTLDTPEFKKALEFYINLKDAGKIMDKDDIVASVSGGNAGMALSWPGWYAPTADTPAAYCVIPPKVSADSEAYPSSIYGVWFLGVPANSQNSEMALKLLEFVTNKENQIKSVDFGGVPTRYSAYEDPAVIEKCPHFETVFEGLQSASYRPMVKQWTEISNALGTELDNAVQGAKDIDTTAADAQAAVERIMMQ